MKDATSSDVVELCAYFLAKVFSVCSDEERVEHEACLRRFLNLWIIHMRARNVPTERDENAGTPPHPPR